MVEGVYDGAGWSYLQRRDRDDAEANRRRALRAHAKLVSLIKEGDGAGAAALWQDHLRDVGRYLAEGADDERTVLDVLDQ
jgi:DNA-binding GntR family transcriptional regulator